MLPGAKPLVQIVVQELVVKTTVRELPLLPRMRGTELAPFLWRALALRHRDSSGSALGSIE